MDPGPPPTFSKRMDEFLKNLDANLKFFRKHPQALNQFGLQVLHRIAELEVVKPFISPAYFSKSHESSPLDGKGGSRVRAGSDDLTPPQPFMGDMCMQPQENGHFFWFNP